MVVVVAVVAVVVMMMIVMTIVMTEIANGSDMVVAVAGAVAVTAW